MMKTTRRLFLACALLCMALSAQAQHRPITHHAFAGLGLLIDSEGSHSNVGITAKAGYGMNIRLSERWSVMPGVGVREMTERPFYDEDGGDDDHFVFLDVPVMLQYHLSATPDGWMFGLGPVFSFCLDNEHHYVNAIPDGYYSEQNKIHTFSVGVQSGVAYQFKHFRIGIEGNIGLADIARKDKRFTESKHLHDVMLVVGYRF